MRLKNNLIQINILVGHDMKEIKSFKNQVKS